MSRRPWSRWLLGVLFVGAGVLHFVMPGAYERLIPDGYPSPRLLVFLSGAAEIAGGLGVLSPWPAVRRAAGWGLAALLVAVYPANIYAAQTMAQPGDLLWWRLPLQGALVAWVLRASGLVAYWSASNVPGHASRARSSGYGA